MEETYQENGVHTDTINAQVVSSVDLKQYMRTDRYPWISNVKYSLIQYATDGKTIIKETVLPNGIFTPNDPTL